MQLIYRAASYSFQPAVAALPNGTETVTRNLFYRGSLYRYELPVNQSLPIPKVINWRFSAPTETQDLTLQVEYA